MHVPRHARHLHPVRAVGVDHRAAEVEGERRVRRPAPRRSTGSWPARGRSSRAPEARTSSSRGSSAPARRAGPEQPAGGVAPALRLAEHVDAGARATPRLCGRSDASSVDLRLERDRVDVALRALAHPHVEARAWAPPRADGHGVEDPELGLGRGGRPLPTARSRAAPSARRRSRPSPPPRRAARDALPAGLHEAHEPVGLVGRARSPRAAARRCGRLPEPPPPARGRRAPGSCAQSSPHTPRSSSDSVAPAGLG